MAFADLDVFARVVQAGSFTRAAEGLGMRKADVSRVIGNLEGKLGARLLERTTRSLSLTGIGREVFERAVGILGAVEETERIAHRMLSEPRGTLRITCGVEFGVMAVGRWVTGYMERYLAPKVRAFIDHAVEAFDGLRGETRAA